MTGPAPQLPHNPRDRTADPTELDVREQLFVYEYLTNGGDIMAAARAVGIADDTATKWMARVPVATAIEKAIRHAAEKANVTIRRIVAEYQAVAFSSIENYEVDPTTLRLRPVPGAPASVMRAVKKIRIRTRVVKAHGRPRKELAEGEVADGPPAEPEQLEVDATIELWPKRSALRDLGEYLKMFREARGDDPNAELGKAENAAKELPATTVSAADVAQQVDDLTDNERTEAVVSIFSRARARMKQADGLKEPDPGPPPAPPKNGNGKNGNGNGNGAKH